MATRMLGMQMDELPTQDPTMINDWIERFGQMALIHEAVRSAEAGAPKNTAKVALFLSCIGADAYSLLKAYLAPDLPSTKTLNELIACVKTNLAPEPSQISEAYKLSKLKQEANESLALYMSRVKQTATRCSYGAAYDRIVKDKFICGVRSEKLRGHLINDTAIETSAQALTKALAREHSENAAQDMSDCNYVQQNRTRNRSGTSSSRGGSSSYRRGGSEKCGKCTLRGHKAADCYTRCNKCAKTGHIAKNCYMKSKKVQNVEQEEANPSSSSDEGEGGVHEEVQNIWYVQMESTTEVTSRANSKRTRHRGPIDLKTQPMSTRTIDTLPHEDRTFDTLSHVDRTFDTLPHEPDNIDCNINKTMYDDILYTPIKGDLAMVNQIVSERYLKIMINGKYLVMEVDTGSSVTCISKAVFEKLKLTGCVLNKCNKVLKVANGQVVRAVYKTDVSIRFRDIYQSKLDLYVVDSVFPTLLGRDWISRMFGENWLSRLISVNQVTSMTEKRQKFIEEIQSSEIFNPELGEVKNYEAALDLKEDHRPKFCKARQVPFALKEALGKELDRMHKEGTLVKVDHSAYASPVVPIIKPDGSIRVCGDYKSTVNPNLDTKVYPLPVVEDCFAEMEGGVLFSKLDIKAAYNNLRLREQDQRLTTMNTHQGLYMWTRLPYGISSSSGIFQAVMDNMLQGMRGVTCRVDDILITGKDVHEHMEKVKEVIRRIKEAGFRCGWKKSEFLKDKVIYLGYEVSKEGVKPCRNKVETLMKAPYPTKLSELVSFLGAAQYYGRFLPQLSTLIEPLNRLRTSKEWIFEKKQRECFDQLKQLLASDRVLTFYDPKKPLRVDCDASAHGIGAVLSHIDENGRDRPIEFISRTLTAAERNYSQIEKEALGIVWSIKRFHRYLYARPFQLYTDHKPLELILHPNKLIPEMGTSRIQRWALILSHYNYSIKFRPTEKHANADVCSRYPLAETNDGMITDEIKSIFSLQIEDDKPLLDSQLIARLSRKDPTISKVIYCVMEGWPERPNHVPGKATGSGDSASRVKDSKRPKSVPDKATTSDEPSGGLERPNYVPGKATSSGDSASRVKHSKRPKLVPDKATSSDEPVAPGKRPVTVPDKATGPGDSLRNQKIKKRPMVVPEEATTSDEPVDPGKRPVTVPDKATGPGDSSEFQAYHCRRNELSTELGCLLWGHRVVIPQRLRKEVLNLLHNTHMGMTAMKGLARNYVWWPRLDSDIEETVRQCNICQMNQRQPNKAAPHPWRTAQNPWERVHLDFAGPFLGRMWMVVVDSYSKWIEVVDMRSNTKAPNVIQKLRTLFSRWGLPKILVSDNGPQLIAQEFETFCSRNGINHIPIPSYHPASNGQAETVVGKFKAAMRKMQTSNGDMGLNLSNWLLNYHNTPHSITGVEPAIRMVGRRIRSALSLVHPLSTSHQQAKEERQVLAAEKTLRRFVVGEQILYRNVLHKSWERGTVKEVSDKQYVIVRADGSEITKHIDHIVASTSEARTEETIPRDVVEPERAIGRYNKQVNVQVPPPELELDKPAVESERVSYPDLKVTSGNSFRPDSEPNSIPSVDRARPTRTTKPPDRLGYEKLGGN